MANETGTAPRVGGFIILTRNLNWQWGPTVEDALKGLRKRHDSARKGERLVFRLPAGALDAWVDQMGSIRWEWTEDADRTDDGETIERPRD